MSYRKQSNCATCRIHLRNSYISMDIQSCQTNEQCKARKGDGFLLQKHHAVFQQMHLSILGYTLNNCQIKIHWQHLKCLIALRNC